MKYLYTAGLRYLRRAGIRNLCIEQGKKLSDTAGIYTLTIQFSTECPTRYRTRHFFNNFITNEAIATKFEACKRLCKRCDDNERTPVQISLQYLNWC
jgi:hypothetical protein